KVKKEKKSDAEDNYESRLSALNEISKPLASKKLNKKLLKTVRKASKAKDIKRGVKEVVKGLRKGNKGLVIIAGDISPIDVITHVPILCEESDVPYCYVPSKEDLGTAGSTKRPTSCVMIVKNKDAEYKDLYEECVSEV
ncbi:L30e-like protein, partial [Neocallimastix californiae]